MTKDEIKTERKTDRKKQDQEQTKIAKTTKYRADAIRRERPKVMKKQNTQDRQNTDRKKDREKQ